MQSYSEVACTATQPLFPTPNGKGLVYALPGDVKPFFRQQDTERARNWIRRTLPKERLLRIYGWEALSGEYAALFADFDQCPHWFKDARCFRAYLRKLFKDRGIVLRTPSGNSKVLFLIQLPENSIMNTEAAIDTLKKLVPEELFNFLDLRVSAMSVCFINQEMFETIEQELPLLKPTPVIVDQLDTRTYSNEYSDSYYDGLDYESVSIRQGEGLYTCGQSHRYRLREQPIGERFNFVRDPLMVQLIKFFLATPSLVEKFDISQKILGDTLDIHRKRAGRLLKKALKMGLIEISDPTYQSGKKAISYRATGLLLQALREIYRTSRKSLPKEIKEGQWNRTLLVNGLAHFRYRPEKLLDWVVTIEGHELKDRMKQARRIVAWLKRNFCATAGNNLIH